MGFQEDVLGEVGGRLPVAREPETPHRHPLEIAAKQLLGDRLPVRRRGLTVSDDQSLVGEVGMGHLPDYIGAPNAFYSSETGAMRGPEHESTASGTIQWC
jgi:hypothetical protein